MHDAYYARASNQRHLRPSVCRGKFPSPAKFGELLKVQTGFVLEYLLNILLIERLVPLQRLSRKVVTHGSGGDRTCVD